jgi:hypothetical protein
MPSFYTVVQYVPDPVADERINIGVIAYSGATVRSQFLAEWKRVQHFGGEDVDFLKDFARRFQRAISRQTDGFPAPGGIIDSSSLERMIGSWHNSIQFTAPRASLHDSNALLREAVQRFLSEPVRVAEVSRLRDQRAARDIAVSRVRGAVKQLVGDVAESLTRQRFLIDGDKAPHKFAVAVANGVPYLAAQAASLERGITPQLVTGLDAIAWSVADTRAHHAALPLGVLLLPARNSSPHFREIDEFQTERTHLYQELGATVLLEDQIEDWARSVLQGVLPRGSLK